MSMTREFPEMQDLRPWADDRARASAGGSQHQVFPGIRQVTHRYAKPENSRVSPQKAISPLSRPLLQIEFKNKPQLVLAFKCQGP